MVASLGPVRESGPAQLWLSLAYLGIVGLMRQAGDGPAGFLPLLIVPVVWLALYGTRRQLLIEARRDRARAAGAVGGRRR